MNDGIVDEIRRLFEENGASQYGGEAVTQFEHALQAATLAEADGTDSQLIAAALLHDIGHLLHDLPEDAPEAGIDDVHELRAHKWLREYFGPAVTEPIRLHVDAKRYLCAVDPAYKQTLSGPSLHSMELQGGAFDADEARQFEQRPFFEQGTRLRRWDDLAKIAGCETPNLEHFLSYVALARQVAMAEAVS
jgi:[1-hydroxy-2-(trimethylamino)ethyl]phosphonate dioxygenase